MKGIFGLAVDNEMFCNLYKYSQIKKWFFKLYQSIALLINYCQTNHYTYGVIVMQVVAT